MNAAIEAAHAGEAGKGFAVVADEIRKLSESSGEQSKTIAAVLKKIKASIDKINMASGDMQNRFSEMGDDVSIVSTQESTVLSAMQEQSAGSRQILDAVSRLNELTELVKQSSGEMLEGSRQVITEARNLEQATEEISASIREMANGSEQITTAVENVSSLTVQNKNGIAVLEREVEKFKID
jgi:methyl-accepting chemotaxis protein